jgi:hypothetical protein
MKIRFRGEIWYWRGPSPRHFVTATDVESALITELAPRITYGWA